jgi:hypothetical protein
LPPSSSCIPPRHPLQVRYRVLPIAGCPTYFPPAPRYSSTHLHITSNRTPGLYPPAISYSPRDHTRTPHPRSLFPLHSPSHSFPFLTNPLCVSYPDISPQFEFSYTLGHTNTIRLFYIYISFHLRMGKTKKKGKNNIVKIKEGFGRFWCVFLVRVLLYCRIYS